MTRNPAAAATTRSWVAAVLKAGGAQLATCAEAIGTLDDLAALWELGWLGTPRASQRLRAAELRARVHALAHATRSLGSCVARDGVRPGDVVLVQGRVVAALPTSLRLAEPASFAEPLELPLAGAVLVGAPTVADGDLVAAVGVFDEVVSSGGRSSSTREPPTMSVVRAGSTLPLVVIARRARVETSGPAR